MAPPPQRRNATHSRPSAPTPMSERQQMALLMQMTSTTEAELSPNSQSNKAKDRNERGETPLHIAAKKGDLEGAKKLLEQGSNPNITDFAGWTPLHEAANHGHYHLAQLLIKFGANVMATGLDDMTPLHDAASFGNQKLVKMLIEKGADPLFKNKKGKSPQDIAHPSLVNFFRSTIDILNKQQKKTTSGDLKKSLENDDTGTIASTSSAPSDIYEFVSTPKHSSCSSGDENPIKSFDKSSDEKSGTDSDTPAMATTSLNIQQKRALNDQTDRNDGTSSPTDEDSKRKKRKDSDFVAKDGGNKANVTSSGTNRIGSRIIGQKIPGPASKTLGLMSKSSGNVERKSPCESSNIQPTKSPEVEVDNDDSKNGESPKVPPLKIVIPQQQSSVAPSNEPQEGIQNSNNNNNNNLRANKSTITRNASGLPYIITNANEGNNATNEKEPLQNTATTSNSTITRGQSPSVDSNKSSDDTKPSNKSKESRILRSSQRSGKDSKDDRSSNNSSPQLPASSTPSPAAQTTDNSSTGNANDSEGHNLGQQTTQASSIQTTSSSTSTIAAQTSSSSLQITSANNNNNNNNQQTTQSQSQAQNPPVPSTSSQNSSVELHPRKRKIKASSKESSQNSSSSSTSSSSSSSNADIKDSNSKDGQEKSTESVHPHDQPFANCYQMYIDLRKQIEQRHRNLHPIEPRPLKGLEDYLMNRRTYSLQGKTPTEPNIIIPPLLPTQMKDTFVEQEKERHRLKMKHIVEKEKLVLSKEQEILRVHCKAAQMIANQSQPFSVCTMLKDEEVYNIITPEQEEKYRNKNRERSHGRVFYQALKELDDKWDKIKEAMIIRHTNEAESLHAVQKMDWDWKLKELALCDYKATPEIEELHVPMVDVSDEYTTPSTSD